MNISDVQLKQGDIFVTRNPMALGRAINFVQKIWSFDNESTYSHAGIIISPYGDTLESLSTIKSQKIAQSYAGKNILIGRHIDMTYKNFLTGFRSVRKLRGSWYPFHRLPLFIIPPLAKYVHTGRFLVCSELVDKFLWNAGVAQAFYKGRNPDHIADMIKRWKGWATVFEGKV